MTGRTVVTREPEFDDEAREWILGHEAYARAVHGPCGNHLEHALDKGVVRMVEIERFECEDCRAIELQRHKFHKDKAHKSEDPDSCKDCAKHIFYVDQRIPIDQFQRR